MGRLQHRRSFSVKANVHARLKAHCDAQGLTMAAVVEGIITDALDQAGAAAPVVARGGYPKRLRPVTEAEARDVAKQAAANFTF
jgi:hypothetical protein